MVISRRRNMVLWLFLMLAVHLEAQNISVTRFYLAENDLTANSRKTEVFDQNGDRCALIRVQTTMKGFHFDVGSSGVQKVDESHVGEVWVYVPYGVKHISVRHKDLGSLPNYDFPVIIQKARTYIMEITSDKVFVNNYDDTRHQKLAISVTPTNASFTLNGMRVNLNNKGEVEQELAFGTYTYRVEAEGYYPKEGQITIDDEKHKQTLIINDLAPITGKLRVFADPFSADVYIDGDYKGRSNQADPFELQIGSHEVEIRANSYKTEKRTVDIKENETSELSIMLSQVALFQITSSPSGAKVTVNKETIGTTPCSKELKTGSYVIKATKPGYKDYEKTLQLSSSTPTLNVSLNKIFNYKNGVYVEANARIGSFVAFGGTVGGYFNNINIEVSYLYGSGNSENVYWNSKTQLPITCTYSPQMNISGKVGYCIPSGTRMRFTPQVGVNFLKLKEKVYDGTFTIPADGANVISGLISLRFSVAIVNHFELSLSPEFSFAMTKSKGYEALSEASSKIKGWGEGFNVKLGIATFF